MYIPVTANCPYCGAELNFSVQNTRGLRLRRCSARSCDKNYIVEYQTPTKVKAKRIKKAAYRPRAEDNMTEEERAELFARIENHYLSSVSSDG